MKCVSLSALMAVTVWLAAGGVAVAAGGSVNVEVIVSPSLHAGGEIAGQLAQYLADIRAQGYNPTLTATPFADAAELRAHLAARRAAGGLAGAVLVGDLPVPYYEIAAHTGWEYENFPSDLFYGDLDGTWGDADGDGSYDSHTGHVAPEVWIGRLTASPVVGLGTGRTEAGLLADYFAKNHAYRTGQMSLAPNGLAYVDDDWAISAGGWAHALGKSISGEVTIVSDRTVTTAADYAARLAGGEYESVIIGVHSNALRHIFETDGERVGGELFGHELEALNPQALFYNLFACSNGRYTDLDYMGGEYLFGTDLALLAVGTTKTGGMLNLYDYYTPLGYGETYGAAMLNWWQGRAAGGFSALEKDWHYGMTLLGDPLLVGQGFLPIPEPASSALLLAGALALLRRRRRTA